MGELKVTSLFCGCGGLDLGLLGDFKFLESYYEKLPYKIVHASDYDKYPVDIYNANFNHNAQVLDILETAPDDYPKHDVLVGGFPCQSFSIVAQNPPRLGYKDDRGKLFFEMCSILNEHKPKAFIAENVKGILSANKGKAFPLIIKNFQQQGYYVTHALLNAADYGVPQKRERVFIVGFKHKKSFEKFQFPKPVFDQNDYVPLSKVVQSESDINPKYYFSKRAVNGMKNANKNMNKGRAQSYSEPCNTLTSHLAKVSLNSTDPVLKPNGKYRRFTPLEVKRIQSFPEGYKLVGSDTRIYKALGNAVPPVMMWYVARQVSNSIK